MRRGISASKEVDKRGSYIGAVNDLNYVLRNARRDFPLLPEVYLQKGMALRYLGDDAAAAAEFLNAVKIKPTYTPAYAALIDVHVDLGDLESARNFLETGLTNVPDSKVLAEKKIELDKRVRGETR